MAAAPEDQFDVVGDDEHGLPVGAHGGEVIRDLGHPFVIETARWFVQYQDLPSCRDRAPDRHTLLLTT